MGTKEIKLILSDLRDDFVEKNPEVEGMDIDELYKYYFREDHYDGPLTRYDSETKSEVRITYEIKHRDNSDLIPDSFFART